MLYPSSCSCRSGLTLTEMIIVIAILGILMSLTLLGLQAAIQHARTSQCANNLRQLAIAVSSFESAHQHLPAGGWGKNWAGVSSQGAGPEQPGGWIYQILPQLEQSNLFASGPPAGVQGLHPSTMLETTLPVLYCPSRRLPRTIPNSRKWNPHLYQEPERVAKNDYAMNGGDTLLVYGEGPESIQAAPRFNWPKMTHATGLTMMHGWLKGSAIVDGRSNVYLVGEKYIFVDDYKTGRDWGDNEGAYSGDDRDLVRFAGVTRYSPLQPLSDRINDPRELADVPAASMGILASYCFWKWSNYPTRTALVIAGLALGGALLTKLVWILLPLIFLVIHAIHQIQRWRVSGADEKWRSANGQLLTILAIAVLTVNVFYGFDRSLKPLGSLAFRSELFAGKRLLELQRGNRFSKSILAYVPVPFPEHFVLGLDTQRRDFEEQKWSYLRGEYKLGGWYYYYAYAWLIKLPIGTLLLLASVASVTSVQISRGVRRFEDAHLLLPAIALFALVSSQTAFNWYVRYTIPALPFLYVWIGKLAFVLRAASSWGRVALALIFCFSAVESLSVFPHSISFFNLAIGGPKNGAKHLLYGGIDVGQDLSLLKKWMAAHPAASPMHIQFSGVMQPSHLGIESLEVPPHEFAPEEKFVPARGWYAVSANYVHGASNVLGINYNYAYFQKLRPIAWVGYSVYIYHVEAENE